VKLHARERRAVLYIPGIATAWIAGKEHCVG
jgi:hypothetical protein